MRPGKKTRPRGGDNSYWTSYSDMMAGMLFVFALILFATVYQLVDLQQKKTIELQTKEAQLSTQQSLLIDQEGLSWEMAQRITYRCMAYTNHTVMAEALERWPVDMMKQTLPRIYMILEELNRRLCADLFKSYPDQWERIGHMAIIAYGQVHMANLCVAGSHSVNGVSALHSEILKDTVFHDFYTITPAKFTNVTNGIAFRRWLCQSNPQLTDYLTELIGDDFIKHSDRLLTLRDYKDDPAVLDQLQKIKRANKERFAKVVKKQNGVVLDPDSIFDVQVKRLHEYKRQQLNVLNIIAQYQALKENPNMDFTPRTYIFASKAAPGYYMAKKIIQLIDALAHVVNNDPDTKDKLKVVFMEDYSVSLAEVLMPAADISEQISLAGTEASGTGNMKLMLNGAVTLGTLDGANVEICNAVGEDNIFLFGMKTPEVEALRRSGYHPMNYVTNNPALKNAIDMIQYGVNGKDFSEITSSLINVDPYMALADFADYQNAQRRSAQVYADKTAFAKMSLMNISGAGIFSADRAVQEYAENIWHTHPVVVAQPRPQKAAAAAEKPAEKPAKKPAAKNPAAKKPAAKKAAGTKAAKKKA